jgi:predicted NBD/HSP70 family sugar kinase
MRSIEDPRALLNVTARRVVRLVRENGQTDRAYLSRATAMTRAAMSQVITPLVRQRVLRSVKAESDGKPGRPTELLEVAGEGVYSIGVAINHHVEVVGIDLGHRVHRFVRFPNPLEDADPDDPKPVELVLRRIAAVAQGLPAGARLMGVGLSAGGGIDYEHMRFLRGKRFASIGQATRLLEGIEQTYRVPLVLEHEARAPLHAERWGDPSLPPRPNMLYIVLDTLGYGLMLNGRAIRGPSGWSDWLGPQVVHPEGRSPPESRPEIETLAGSLHATASTEYLLAAAMNRPYKKRLHLMQNRSEMRQLALAYRQGDPRVRGLVHQAGRDLGIVCRNLAILFALDRIVLTGWTRGLREAAIVCIKEIMAQAPNGNQVQEPFAAPVRSALLGRRQQAIGAALVAFDFVLSEPTART